MPKAVVQSDMDAVYSLTDELGIHREAVTVPLRRQDPGSARRLPGGGVEITVPENGDVPGWVQRELRPALANLGFEELP